MGLFETIRRCYLTFEDQCLHLGSLGGLCQRVPSPISVSAPLSSSLPLSSCQDDEALASCSPLFEQHACSEESWRTQGPEPPQDLSSDLVPFSGACPSPSVLLPSDGLLIASEQDQCNKTEGAPPEREGESPREEGLGGGRSQEVSVEPRGGACRTEEPGGLCFYAGISSPCSPPPALSHLDFGESPPSEQSLDEEPDKLQGAEENLQTPKKQKKRKTIDALPAFVRDGLDFSEQSPLEKQSDPLRCEDNIPGDNKEALLSLGKDVEKVAGVEKGAGEAGAQGTKTIGRGGCSIQDLDGLCLTRIMSCLDNASLRSCSLVCREWLETSNHSRSKLVLQEAPQVASLPRFLVRFPHLRNIHMIDAGASEESALPCDPDCLSLGHLALSCGRLRFLRIVRCEASLKTGLAAVLRGCPDLKVLILEQCGGFTGSAFEGVRCRLKRLDLLYCGGLTNEGLRFAAAACPRLEDLTVEMEGEGVSLAGGLERFAKLCPTLQWLTVHACGVTNATLRNFARHCPLLFNVAISCEPNVTDAGVWALQQHLTNLHTLTVVNNPQLIQVPRSSQFVRLESLGIGPLLDVSDVMLRRLSEEVGLKELRVLECPALSDVTIERILRSCLNLELLRIGRCESLTPKVLEAYKQSGNKTQLEILQCKGIQAGDLSEELRLLGKVVVE